MYVCQKNSGDPNVYGPTTNWEYAFFKLKQKFESYIVSKVFRSSNTTLHSTGFFSSKYSKRINLFETDLVHLHWINYNMLSIADIGRISKPTIWTIHDMWPFCGAEHITEGFRWKDGYYRGNRRIGESGIDLNRWVHKAKQYYWKKPIQIVTPSKWLRQCVNESQLMCDWPVSVIPNPIDTNIWKPFEQKKARELWNLPLDVPLVLFGAMGGGRDPNKGFDLLIRALRELKDTLPELEVIIFGEQRSAQDSIIPCKAHYCGHLYDDISLVSLYNAADVTVVPSRIENLPNTAVESQSCGVPVVGFDTCGLKDVIQHKVNGYLAKKFDELDFAKGIDWVIKSKGMLTRKTRESAVKTFSYENVLPKYIKLYKDMLDKSL